MLLFQSHGNKPKKDHLECLDLRSLRLPAVNHTISERELSFGVVNFFPDMGNEDLRIFRLPAENFSEGEDQPSWVELAHNSQTGNWYKKIHRGGYPPVGGGGKERRMQHTLEIC